jgi:hypothetical protein
MLESVICPILYELIPQMSEHHMSTSHVQVLGDNTIAICMTESGGLWYPDLSNSVFIRIASLHGFHHLPIH